MKLADLKQGQTVTARYGRAGEMAASWGPWHEVKIDYLVRRETDLPKRLRTRTNAPDKGDIVGLAVEGWPAEYSQGDFENGIFTTEDWYLEIKDLA